MRNLKLEQLLLLLLRAAIVAVLAFALADPVRQTPPPPRRGQVLLSPDLLHSTSLGAVRSTIDSLRRGGYELRQLAPRLPLISPAAWRRFDSLATATSGPSTFEPAPDNLWARVQQAADSLPERPLRVFTLATQHRFQGTRPALPATVRWQTVPAPDSSGWLQAAHQTSATDSLRLLVGASNEAATTFRTVALAPAAAVGGALRVAGLPPLRYEPRLNGPALIRPATGAAVPVRNTALRLAIYYDGSHAQDAQYLRAALRAASLGLPLAPLLTISTTPPSTNQPLDWLFWLSDTPLPAAWQARVRQGLHLWQEAPSPGFPTEATLASASPVRLLRRDTLRTPESGSTLWADGLGRPVLSRLVQGQGAGYQLHTRLHPAWSELASSAELPGLLLPLLQPEQLTLADSRHDQRSLDATQIVAGRQAVAPSRAQTTTRDPLPSTNLRPWVVVLAALLFGLERWLARRRLALSSSATV
jgi:hypothetical protein